MKKSISAPPCISRTSSRIHIEKGGLSKRAIHANLIRSTCKNLVRLQARLAGVPGVAPPGVGPYGQGITSAPVTLAGGAFGGQVYQPGYDSSWPGA